MAGLVAQRSDRTELDEMAGTIVATQGQEIDTMNTLLEEAGQEPAATEMDGMAHGGHDGMSGMMTADQLAELESLEGEAFDLMFLDLMTEHHQGAIESAQQVLDDGQNPQVTQLAEDIIDAQQAEIEQMATWRDAWSS